MTRMKDVSHTNPFTGEAFGEQVQVFERGKTVAADGGERDPTDGDDETEAETETEEEKRKQTMEDVDHTPPNESDGANRVYERGTEGRDETQ